MTPSRFILPLALVLTLVALPGSAAAAQGVTTIKLGGKSVASLRAQGVTIAAKRPARIVRRQLRLPITGGLVTGSATLNQGGALVLRRKHGHRRLSIKIKRLQVRIGRRSTVVGTIGSRRLAIFAIAGRGASLNSTIGSAKLDGARVTLAARAAKAIKRKLRLARLPVRGFGKATVEALVTPGAPGGGGAGGGGIPGGGGGIPGGGPPGGGKAGPIAEAPTFPRPEGARDVGELSFTWSPRDSWLRYIAGGEGTTASDGASALPATETSPCPDTSGSALLPYSFAYSPGSGWYDPATGQADITFAGRVHFGWKDHTIDLSAGNPEIAITPTETLGIFRLDGTGGTSYPNQRASMLTIPVTPQPGLGPGAVVSASYARAKLTPEAKGAFLGAYDDFGCVTFSFKVL